MHIIILILVSIFFGCHDTVELMRDKVAVNKPSGDITVWTGDGLVYQFGESKYWVVNDSIRDMGTVTNGDRTKLFKGSAAWRTSTKSKSSNSTR